MLIAVYISVLLIGIFLFLWYRSSKRILKVIVSDNISLKDSIKYLSLPEVERAINFAIYRKQYQRAEEILDVLITDYHDDIKSLAAIDFLLKWQATDDIEVHAIHVKTYRKIKDLPQETKLRQYFDEYAPRISQFFISNSES